LIPLFIKTDFFNINIFKLLKMKLAIVGSRKFNDYEFFKVAVYRYLNSVKPEIIISGGATGVDSLAEKWAGENNVEFLVFPADWKLGRSAGPIRNTLIVNNCTHLLAFPDADSVGTWDSVRKAELANKKVTVIKV